MRGWRRVQWLYGEFAAVPAGTAVARKQKVMKLQRNI